MNRLSWIVLGAVAGVTSCQLLGRHLPERVVPLALSFHAGWPEVGVVERRKCS